MSDPLKHECGVALLRLRKPLEYYATKYGTTAYGFSKLSLLMEKQHNRGQDGAGIACVGLDVPPGKPFYQLEKSCSSMPLADLLERISGMIETGGGAAADSLARPFCGEVYLGHLRYGTYGNRTLAACHPMVSDNARRAGTLLVAGNFNLTNTPDVFNHLTSLGYHPHGHQDCEILLTMLSHYLGEYHGDLLQAVKNAAAQWDGGHPGMILPEGHTEKLEWLWCDFLFRCYYLAYSEALVCNVPHLPSPEVFHFYRNYAPIPLQLSLIQERGGTCEVCGYSYGEIFKDGLGMHHLYHIFEGDGNIENDGPRKHFHCVCKNCMNYHENMPPAEIGEDREIPAYFEDLLAARAT